MALSDGIFGVGMTLLVLDLRTPLHELVHGEHDLQAALLATLPQLIMYLMSFMTLGIFWVGQQTLYAFGAALCVFDTRISIAWIVLVQLFYVLGPDFHPRN